MAKTAALFFILWAVLLTSTVALAQEELVFPEDTYDLINVRDYGAVGDGAADDTQALQNALNAGSGGTVYLPAGTYRITNQLLYPYKRTVIMGESRDRTIIRLADGSPGFSSGVDRPVLQHTQSSTSYIFDAFRTGVYNLTIAVGKDNPNASGIAFMANNQGGMRNVRLVSESAGTQTAGIRMKKDWPGPALIKNIEVEGFSLGIDVACFQYSLTMENILLRNCGDYGIYNYGNVLNIYGLETENIPRPFYQAYNSSMSVLVNGRFSGSFPENTAVEIQQGNVFVRNLQQEGYAALLADRTVSPPVVKEEAALWEYYYTKGRAGGGEGKPYTLFESPAASLNLPVEDWEPEYEPGEAWYNAVRDGGVNTMDKRDDTAALQAAFNSGKATVYLPKNEGNDTHGYYVSSTISIPSSVKMVISTGAKIHLSTGMQAGNQPVFSIRGGGEPLVMEGFWFHKDGDANNAWFFDIDAQRDVKLRNISVHNIPEKNSEPFAITAAGTGKLFLEDLAMGRVDIENKTVYARQLNVETDHDLSPMVRNRGGRLWVLGMKTERQGLCIQTTEGGETELLGGFIYPTKAIADSTPILENDNSSVTAVFCSNSNQGDKDNGKYYKTIIREIREGESKSLIQGDLPSRIVAGNAVALYSGYTQANPGPSPEGGIFLNDFEEDPFVWNCGQNFALTRTGGGYPGMCLTMEASSNTSGNYAIGTVPESWQDMSGIRYLSFYLKGSGQAGEVEFTLKSKQNTVYEKITVNLTPEDTQWKRYSFPLTDNSGGFVTMDALSTITVKLRQDTGPVWLDGLMFTRDLILAEQITVSGSGHDYMKDGVVPGPFQAEMIVRNVGAEVWKGALYCAIYDEIGRLYGVSRQEAEILPGASQEIWCSGSCPEDGKYKIGVFLWGEDMKPVKAVRLK